MGRWQREARDGLPASRRAGRAAGGVWNEHGEDAKRVSAPVRGGWALVMSYVWLTAYLWIGLILSTFATRLGRGGGLVTVACVGGGVALGIWQARHRLARHKGTAGRDLPRFGLALLVWVVAIAATMLVAGE